MEYRRLGKNGPLVSIVGFGAWPIGGGMGHMDEADAIRVVHAAMDRGINLIDTAEAYIDSERVLGKALAGGRRERVLIATKASNDFSPKGMRAALETSLRALDTDRVDLYQIHRWNEAFPIEASMEEMLKLREEGKIRLIGVSNFSVDQMKRAASVVSLDSSQPRYNALDREIEAAIIPYCAAEGIGILAHSVFAKGLLTGKYTPDHRFSLDDERSHIARFQGDEFRSIIAKSRKLAAVASDAGMTLVGLCLAWVLRKPEISSALQERNRPNRSRNRSRQLICGSTRRHSNG